MFASPLLSHHYSVVFSDSYSGTCAAVDISLLLYNVLRIADRASFYLLQGWMGPNYSISTACATSNFCILNAANHIIRGEAVSSLLRVLFLMRLEVYIESRNFLSIGHLAICLQFLNFCLP